MAIQTLRPNGAPSSNVATALTGAASVQAALSDSSDASYVEYQSVSGLAANTYGFPLTTYTLGAGESVKRYRVGVRHKGAAAGTYSATAFVDTNGGGAPLSASSITVSGRSSFGVDTGGWVNGPLTQAQIDNLMLGVYGTYISGGTNAQLAELYIELDINVPPTATVTAPTGAQTIPSPVVTWTYADADSDAQAKYQIKIFNAATYGAGGFSADTSTASWDSGQVSGIVTTVTVGTALVDGTYKAYVRVNDGNGWSAWASGSAFTVSSTPPVIPAVPVPTVVNTTPWHINVDVQSYINMVDYEDADFVTSVGNWIANANCSVSRSTTVGGNNGTAALRLSSTASGAMSAILSAAGRRFASPGKAYRAFASVRAGASARNCFLSIVWYDINNNVLSTVDGSTVADAVGSWTTISVTGTAPANTVFFGLKVTVNATGGAAELHYVDTLQMTPTNTVVAWMRGGLVNNAEIGLERSLDNGVTWTPVAYTPYNVSDYTQFATLSDREVPNGTPVIYRSYVTTSDDATGAPYRSDYTASSSPVTPAYVVPSGWLLKDLYDGSFTQELPLVNPPFKYSIPEQQAAYSPLGRSRKVIVSDNAVQGAEFELNIEFLTLAAFNAFLAIRNNQRTLLLQQNYLNRQWYIRLAEKLSVEEQITGIYNVSIEATEVDQVVP